MPKNRNRVSEAVIRRMPKYYRYLKEMERGGVEKISSRELSQRMGLTASQIRQDFNCFGGFGQQGYGYNVSELRKEIRNILGLGSIKNVVIIGAGNLGQALANYSNFEREGFRIKALFDINPKLIGMSIRGIQVLDLDELEPLSQRESIQIGVITTPRDQAQKIADLLVKCGIKGIWNFAPTDVEVPNEVIVENVHLSDSLYVLSLRLSDLQDKKQHDMDNNI